MIPTQRKVLAFNMLLLFLSLSSMACFSLVVCYLFYDTANSEDTIFYNWLVLGMIEVIMSWVCVVGLRGVHLLSFEMLLLYFWGVTMFFGPLIMSAVAGFDFYLFLKIWIKHSWVTAMFSEFRRAFCEPGTADGQCAAPLRGGIEFNNVTHWCMANFDGQTDCQAIRDAAETDALDISRTLILIQGSVGITNCVQIGLSMYLCYHILSAQVITKSMNDTMNYLLMLPIFSMAGMTWYTWWMRDLAWDLYWVPEAFLLLCLLQIIQVPLGIAGGRLKAPKILLGCIVLISIILCALALLGVMMILYAISWQGGVLVERSQLDDIACINAFNGCCCCDQSTDQCPEWNADEIVTFMVINLKIFGMVAFISMIYYFGAVSVTDITRKSLKHYRSEFI